MLSDEEIDRDASQLAIYQTSDALSEILGKYSNLIQEYRRLKSDYEEERDGREKYKQVAKSSGRNPFVLVLVDGSSYVFHEDLVGKGPDAGSAAAQALHDAIRSSLRKKGLAHCQIMIRVYADVVGLSKAIYKAGGPCGAEKRSLAPFIASFNKSNGLTDFIDAGEDRDDASVKLRAAFNLFADNAQCKHIFLAACHDVSYLPDLTPYSGNSARFTLLDSHGINFHREFSKLGMGIDVLPGVFRDTPLEAVPAAARPRAASTTPGAANGASPPPAVQPPANTHPNYKTVACHNYPGNCRFGDSCRFLHVDEAGNDANNSWTAAPQSDAEFSAAAAAISALPDKTSIPYGHVAVNCNGFRLDPAFPFSSPEVNYELTRRTKNRRVCNNFHLNGYCPMGDGCAYDHSLLDHEFTAALEALARSSPCGRRGACRDVICTKGHVCQVADCRHRGGKAFCRIPFASHSEELIVAQYVPAILPAMGHPPPYRHNGFDSGGGGGGGGAPEDVQSTNGGAPTRQE